MALNIVPFVSVDNMMKLVLHLGIDRALTDLAAYIEEDFRRWFGATAKYLSANLGSRSAHAPAYSGNPCRNSTSGAPAAPAISVSNSRPFACNRTVRIMGPRRRANNSTISLARDPNSI